VQRFRARVCALTFVTLFWRLVKLRFERANSLTGRFRS
jgi:hypothetical protein